MAVGLGQTTLANNWLNMLRSVAFTAPVGSYVKLHVGDPGAAGANNAAAGSTTRVAAVYAAASAGSLSLTGTLPSWTNGGTTETLTNISVWDASTVGNFLYSAALSSSQSWVSGNTFTLNALTFALNPLAA